MNDEPEHRVADNNPIISEDQMLRAVAALYPFVQRGKLPLNPEDLHKMAAAVLTHYRGAAPGTPGGWDEIDRAVNAQIDEFEKRAREMYR